MRAISVVGIVFLPLLASCAGTRPLAPAAPPETAATHAPPAVAPVIPAPAVASAPTPSPSIAKAAPPTAPAPARTPAPTVQIPKTDSTAPDNAKSKAPPLDLASLEQRLKNTNAIGVLTKLTLKNQVDDLVGQFRAFYQGKLKTTLAELRRSYDLLVQKVLSLLQDSDPPLATAIVASRDAIWGILSDPKKFATI